MNGRKKNGQRQERITRNKEEGKKEEKINHVHK
jgi:hypothetical protein